MIADDEVAAVLSSWGVHITGLVHDTSKSMLALGDLAGCRVAVKILRDTDKFWIEAWRRETAVNEVFTRVESAVPVRVPRLLRTDHRRVMVLEWAQGHRLDNHRYPRRLLTSTEVGTMLAAAAAINQWRPPASPGIGAVFDYLDRFARYRHRGLLTDADCAALHALMPAAGTPAQFNHGDLLASNVLITDTTATVIDWEFAGFYLPGLDLALMYTQLGAATPLIRQRINTAVAAHAIEVPFVINLATIVTRELHMHREATSAPYQRETLACLESLWERTRDRLHATASGK